MPPYEVEVRDKPEWGPMTFAHILSPLFILAVFLAASTIVWIGELCLGPAQNKQQGSKKSQDKLRTNNQSLHRSSEINDIMYPKDVDNPPHWN